MLLPDWRRPPLVSLQRSQKSCWAESTDACVCVIVCVCVYCETFFLCSAKKKKNHEQDNIKFLSKHLTWVKIEFASGCLDFLLISNYLVTCRIFLLSFAFSLQSANWPAVGVLLYMLYMYVCKRTLTHTQTQHSFKWTIRCSVHAFMQLFVLFPV